MCVYAYVCTQVWTWWDKGVSVYTVDAVVPSVGPVSGGTVLQIGGVNLNDPPSSGVCERECVLVCMNVCVCAVSCRLAVST